MVLVLVFERFLRGLLMLVFRHFLFLKSWYGRFFGDLW